MISPGLPDVAVCYNKKAHVGAGMYGVVFLAKDKVTGADVALKQMNGLGEGGGGFPLTSLREINILRKLRHENIVKLHRVVAKYEGPTPVTLFLAFDYLSYDLFGILRSPNVPVKQEHIKSWSFQLIKGLHFAHQKGYIHRDIKPANILVSSAGVVKIADWGLARSFPPPDSAKRLTMNVVTLWYRPPELLLGKKNYSQKVDIWSAGCVIAEMFKNKGSLFAGPKDPDQIKEIWEMLGVPPPNSWAATGDCKEKYDEYTSEREYSSENKLDATMRRNARMHGYVTENFLKLLNGLLCQDPDQRITAFDAMDADYFFDKPLVIKTENMKDIMNFKQESIHEKNVKDRKQMDKQMDMAG
ncbi:hypothetical protein TrVE_jg5468 [Triparma verrucosa]|nr:hypothetical protein TrVE_jg5468 [Triparma verrucosa]